MGQITVNSNRQEEWLKVLGKGMVTIPKSWRRELGFQEGDILRAKKEGNKVILEGRGINSAPYRIYTSDEIEEFLTEDKIPSSLANKASSLLESLKKDESN